MFYATCRCVAFVIGKNAHFIIALVMCVIVYVVEIFAMTDPMIFSVVTTSAVCAVFSVIMTFLTPALALVCAVIKSKKSSVKSEDRT